MNDKKIAVNLTNFSEVSIKDIHLPDMNSSDDGWSRMIFAVLTVSMFTFIVAVGFVFSSAYFPKNKLPKIKSEQNLVESKLDNKLNTILASKDYVSFLI